MNKRKLNQIITLFHDGLSLEICISSILDLMGHETSINKSLVINEFLKAVFTLNIKQKTKSDKEV